MKQRIHPMWLVALVFFLALVIPLTRAVGQEANPSGGASDTPSTTKSPSVIIDGKGNGVIHSSETETSGKGLTSSHITAGLGVKDGMAVVTSKMAIPDAKDGKGTGYLEANGKKIFGVASFSANLDAKDKTPLLDVNLSVKQDANTSAATGKLNLDWTADKAIPFTAMGLDATIATANYKTSQASWHFTMAGDMVKMKITPELKSGDIKISEAAGVTTLVVSLTVPGASDMAGMFKDMAKSPSDAEQKIQQGLQSQGFSVQSVKAANVRATADEAGADITIVIKDLRKSLSTMLGSVLARMGGAADLTAMQKAIDEILEIQLDNVEIKATPTADKFDVTITSTLSNLDKGVLGYLDLYTTLMPAVQKASPHKQTPIQELAVKAGIISMQRFRSVWEQATANSSDKQNIKFSLQATASATNEIKVTGDLDSSGDIKSIVSAAKAGNYPMMDSQYLLVKVKSDGKTATGSAYLDASGAWFDGLKAPYAEAAKDTPGMEDLATILPTLEFNDSKMSFELTGGNINGNGYLQLSDLTPIVKAALAKNAPNFKGDFVAINFVSDNPSGTTITNDADMYLSGLPNSEADVKADLANLGELGNLPVKTGDAKDTTPPTLTKPTVAMPSDLQSVADSARKELGIAALPVPGVPGGKTVEGSNTNMMLLIAGIAIIVIVGLAAASKGGKKA